MSCRGFDVGDYLRMDMELYLGLCIGISIDIVDVKMVLPAMVMKLVVVFRCWFSLVGWVILEWSSHC